HRALRAPLERCRRVPVLGTLLGVLATPLTVALVFLGWIPFRAQGFEGAWSTFSGLFAPGGESLLESGHHFLIGFAILGAVLEERYRWSTRVVHASLGMRAAFLAGALVVLELFAVTDAAIPFVYFQF
ncbi:MAG: hypothetical protein O2816_19680, partial [Planctomycetota bacterium]|nr:hypothetical protein [Planctomycetota bacterium]